MSINIKLAKEHENQINDPEIRRELTEIQNFISEQNFNYMQDTINFVLIRAYYYDVKKSMTAIGVYVNKTQYTIYGLKGRLNLNFKNLNAEIASMNLTFPPEFIGELKPDEGLLLHLDIPVKGLNEDAVFTVKDLTGGLYNIEFIKNV